MSFATTLSDAFMVVFRAPPETHEEVAARVEEERDDAASPGPIEIRKAGLNDLVSALREGFDDLRVLDPARSGQVYDWAYAHDLVIGSGVNVVGTRRS